VITSSADFARCVFATDLDGDGDADVLSASIADHKVAWYENLSVLDCNGNGVPDVVDIALGTSIDCNANGIPDECEVDCNSNGIPDTCDVSSGSSPDCNTNGIPDECDLASGYSMDIDGDGQLDDCFAPPLMADTYELSVAAGGTQALTLSAPAALDFYFIFGSTSGTSPGVASGGFVVPLNIDSYLLHTATLPNHPPLSSSFGILLPAAGAGGQATASFSLPPAYSASLIGLTLHHAYVTVDFLSGNMSFVSNAVPLALMP
jgi:hypothetical protein